jgi:hypothetical protein
VVLNTEITSELRVEGSMRELLRLIQDKRKEIGLMPRDSARARIPKDAVNKEVIALFEKHISTTASLKEIVQEDRPDVLVEKV